MLSGALVLFKQGRQHTTRESDRSMPSKQCEARDCGKRAVFRIRVWHSSRLMNVCSSCAPDHGANGWRRDKQFLGYGGVQSLGAQRWG